MNTFFLIHGEESALIEAKKKELLSQFSSYKLESFSEESLPAHIMTVLQEDALFGDPACLLMEDVPFVKTTQDKKTTLSAEWEEVQKFLLAYEGGIPIILCMHGTVDRRLKSNKLFLEKATVFHFPKLFKAEVLAWSEAYCRQHHHALTTNGRDYLYGLLELWENVPISFLKTEFDRLFLFLPPKGNITASLLAEEGSDYGSKNIFKFTEALFSGQMDVLLELLPFVSSPKEIDRFLAYLEGQLRLQLMTLEGYQAGKSYKTIYDELTAQGYSVKSYPVKLAYGRCKSLSYRKLRILLYGLYELTFQRRKGQIDPHALECLCIAYCS